MKMKKAIKKIIVLMIVLIMGIGATQSFATSGKKELKLSPQRYIYVDGEYVSANGYALQGQTHPIFQILAMGENDLKEGTNYYCLNAEAGNTWLNGNVNTPVKYNEYFDLDDANLNDYLLSNYSNYSYITSSKYIKQIMWILNNMYIPNKEKSDDDNISQKRKLLSNSGIEYSEILYEDDGDIIHTGEYAYKYVAKEGYDYTDLVYRLSGGDFQFYYRDENGNIVSVDFTDDLVESVQQAAIWYFTNGENNELYDWYNNTNGLNLLYADGAEITEANDAMADEEVIVNGYTIKVGAFKNTMATVLYKYLIDAANNYAKENETEEKGSPVSITTPTDISKLGINNKNINNTNYYVAGPIKIDETRKTSLYTLDTILVNNSSDTGAYISDSEGKATNKTLQESIGTEFYITIPAEKVKGSSNININFTGTYKTNEKILWISTSVDEQPIVEVSEKDEEINLPVSGTIAKTFDLALQKYITSIMRDGSIQTVGRKAPTITTKNLADKTLDKTTAVYSYKENGNIDKTTAIKVKSGDYVTYTFTVYNEGDIDGYVNEIKDNIPSGLQFVNTASSDDEEEKNLIVYDSNGKVSELTVDEETYNLVYKNNTHWSVDLNSAGKPDTSETFNDENTIKITCNVADYLEDVNDTTGNQLLKAYDSSKDVNYDGSGLDRLSVTVVLRVSEDAKVGGKIRNEAAITKATDVDGNEEDGNEEDKKIVDRDSKTTVWDGKDGDKNYQDDEDYDNIVVEKIDIALTKFIAAVSSDDDTIEEDEYLTGENSRETLVNTTPLKNGGDDAIYTQVKTPYPVNAGDYVLYDIRVYNEGDVDMYAGQITDYLPDYLDYVYCDLNDQFGWNDSSSDGKTITTSYLSYNEETKDTEDDQILKAFDKTLDDGNGSKLDYKDLQILCRVSVDAPEETHFVNTAAVTVYQSEDGNDLKEDIDSQPVENDEKKLVTNEEKNNHPGEGNTQTIDKVHHQDDDDFDVVYIKEKVVDLALTKFIAAVSDDETIEDGEYLTANKNIGSKTNPYNRATKVNTTPLKEWTEDSTESHDAIYTLDKKPLSVSTGDYVLYNIRVYNEGDVDVYAGQVTDYLPDYLDYVECDFNKSYGWSASDTDKKIIITNKLQYQEGNTDNLLKAFDAKSDDGNGSKLDYKDLQILCKVNDKATANANLVNTAAITVYQDKNGKSLSEDKDSQPVENDENKLVTNEEKNNHPGPDNTNTIDTEHHQDDDDYDVICVKEKIADLALTKFIAAVSSNDSIIEDGEYLTANKNIGTKTNPYDRATEVDTTPLIEWTEDSKEPHDAIYKQDKTPLTVKTGDYVLYDIRVYNEGDIDAYADQITDYLPNYLDYVYCDINDQFGWDPGSDGKTITTSYLGYKEGNNEVNLLKAFDKKTDDGQGSGLDYRDLQILCKVNDQAPSNENLVNNAAITSYKDKDGDDIENEKDSDPDPIPDEDRNKEKRSEDDDDYDVIVVRTFDLSLLKYVSTVYVTEDGETKTTQTGNTGDDNTDIIPKVEINRKKINSTVVKFGYTIKITNEGDIAGYAKEITDYVPEGLQFFAEDNTGWTDEGNNVISTRLLENTLLQPGESAEVTVIFRWINGSNNLGLKTNIAEISEDYNDEGVPDKDSDPDNRKEGEDDIDDAQVILSISTGLVNNIVMYMTIGTICLIVLATGIITIKKYVL